MTKRPLHTLPAPQQAGILCANPRFDEFILETYGFCESPAHFLRGFCNVESRRDLATNPNARELFDTLCTEFDAWTGKIGRPDRPTNQERNA